MLVILKLNFKFNDYKFFMNFIQVINIILILIEQALELPYINPAIRK